MNMSVTDWATPEHQLCYHPCNVTDTDRDTIYGISIGFGISSLIGVLAIIGHAVAKRICFTTEVRPLVHLSVANAGFSICLVTLTSLYLHASPKHLEPVTIYLITLEEVFYLISFYLTANYMIVVYVRLWNILHVFEEYQVLETQKTIRRMLKSSYLLSWILPPLLLVPVTVSVLVKPVRTQLCLLCPSVIYYPRTTGTVFDSGFWKNFGFILVIVTYVIVAATILVFFTLSLRLCSKLLKRENIDEYEHTTVRWLRTRMSLYILSFFYCWTPTFVVAILVLVVDLFSIEVPKCVILFFIWAVTAPCHGIILASIYFYSIFNQTTKSQLRRERRPFGSRIYRFYGTGSQRSKWPKVRTPSPSLSEGSPVTPVSGDINANSGMPSSTAVASTSGTKKQRRPSFLALLKDQDNELAGGNAD